MCCIAIVARTGNLIDRGLPFYMNAFKMIQSSDIVVLYAEDETVERNVQHMLPILRKVHTTKRIMAECVSEKELHVRSLQADELIVCNMDVNPFIAARQGKLTIVPSYFKVPSDRVDDVKTVQRNVIVTAWFDCKRDNHHNKPGEREHHIDNFFKAVTNADIFVVTDNDLVPDNYGWMMHVHVIRKQLSELMLYSAMNWITACANRFGYMSEGRQSDKMVHLVWFSKIPIVKEISDMIDGDYAFIAWHDIGIMHDNRVDAKLFTYDSIYPVFEIYPFSQAYMITTEVHFERLRTNILHGRAAATYIIYPYRETVDVMYKMYIIIVNECIRCRITVAAEEILYILMEDLSSNLFLINRSKGLNPGSFWGVPNQFNLSIHDYIAATNTPVRFPRLPISLDPLAEWLQSHGSYSKNKYQTLLNEGSDIF